MRSTAQSPALRVRAIAGSYVVVLAWDTLTGKKPAEHDLLGFFAAGDFAAVADWFGS